MEWTVQIQCPTAARAEHKVAEADLNEQHRRCQAVASKPEGPAAPVVCKEAARIASASRPSNKIRFTTLGGSGNKVEESGGLPSGYLSRKIFLVVATQNFAHIRRSLRPPGHSDPAHHQKSGKRGIAEQHVLCLVASND